MSRRKHHRADPRNAHTPPMTANVFVGTCAATQKRQYPDKATAKRINRMRALGLHPYMCPACGFVHLGSLSGLARSQHREYHADDPTHLEVSGVAAAPVKNPPNGDARAASNGTWKAVTRDGSTYLLDLDANTMARTPAVDGEPLTSGASEPMPVLSVSRLRVGQAITAVMADANPDAAPSVLVSTPIATLTRVS